MYLDFLQVFYKQTNQLQFHGEEEDILLKNFLRTISKCNKISKGYSLSETNLLMVNNGIVIGGMISTIAIVFAVFVSFNAISENEGGELIVTNGNHGETVGEVTGIERSYEYSLIDIFEKSEESVVQVNVLRGESDGGMGSGFVYTDDGYIITNQHVVRDAQKVTVTFLDGEAYIGDVVGRDRDLDIAVVKVNPSNTYIQPIKIGDS